MVAVFHGHRLRLEGQEEDREIKASHSEDLRFEFDDHADSDAEAYSLTVRFAQGCEVTTESLPVLETGYGGEAPA